MADVKPGSWEPGFFIEFVLDERVTEDILRQEDLPSPFRLSYERSAHPERYPSLIIISSEDRAALPASPAIPYLCYGECGCDYIESGGHCLAVLSPPYTRDRMTDLVCSVLDHPDFPLPGGYLRLADRRLISTRGILDLAKGEERLLRAFLSGRDSFRTKEELKLLTGRKDIKSLIFRLKKKMQPFLASSGPLQLVFSCVRDRGYYLGITVDNLWKTV